MRIIIENSARNDINNIYYFNSQYSLDFADSVDINLNMLIHNLEKFPYVGRYVPEIQNKNYREIIYRRTKHTTYRVIYYISETLNSIYILNIFDSRQNKKFKFNNY